MAASKKLTDMIIYKFKIVQNAFWVFLATISIIGCVENNEYITISSPSETNTLQLTVYKGQLFYRVNHGNKKVVALSQLGFKFKNGQSLLDDFEVVDVDFNDVDETWEQPWGEEKLIRNNYRACTVSLQAKGNVDHQLDIIVRAYDDGVAFRYHVKKLGDMEKVIISDEITEFNIVKDAQSWWIKAYGPNRYEQLYTSTPISEIDTVHTPLTMRFKNGIHLSIHEADLINYSAMQIAGRQSTSLHCDLAPWSNGDKVRLTIPFKTPWRTIKITDTARDLIASHLTLNCNPPNKLGDVSWIKPSKYIGIWWGMIVGKWTWGEGFRHGATNARGKKHIDFAAKHGFDEVLIEGASAGFTGLFPGDTVTTSYTKTTPDFDLIEVQQYAKSKGVSLQAYHETSASTRNYMAQIDDAFSLMNQIGMQKAKIGHVGQMMDKVEYHYGQHGVNYYRKVLEKAAEYKVGVNFHEPIKDTGERRTYPNMLTREGAKGMEYNAWGNGGNPVSHTTILAFTRMLEAPMDFTPGIFDLLYQKMDVETDNEIPVKIIFVDEGNGYSNIRYKGGESFWQTKPMILESSADGAAVWSITEMMKPGEWEWGISAHDVLTDNNNAWLPSLLNLKNRKINISADGKISGDVSIRIPNQGFDAKAGFTASKEDMESIGTNVFGKTQRVNTTLAKQLAYYLVLYSPMQMASDFIENYENQAAFAFIKEVPVDWQTTEVIDGEIGEYVTIARKDSNSEDWYLGSITNEKARDFSIPLDFLDEDKKYAATIYRDANDAHWEHNPLALTIEEATLEKPDKLRLKLAPGGGVAVSIKALD